MSESLLGGGAVAGLIVLSMFCAIGSAFLLWALVQIEHDLEGQTKFNRRVKNRYRDISGDLRKHI
jgi:hypothetical protein